MFGKLQNRGDGVNTSGKRDLLRILLVRGPVRRSPWLLSEHRLSQLIFLMGARMMQQPVAVGLVVRDVTTEKLASCNDSDVSSRRLSNRASVGGGSDRFRYCL